MKSPSAEYSADYSGGFIIVNTKEIPTENNLTFSVGGNWNTSTVFKDFSYAKGSATDFLAFDNGLRSLRGGIDASFNKLTDAAGNKVGDNLYSLRGNGLNNDWPIRSRNPIGDLKLAASMARRWNIGGRTLGLLVAINYTNEQRTYSNMQNNLFGIYDAVNDRSNYLRYSTDDQYNNNVRLGAMLNLTFTFFETAANNNRYFADKSALMLTDGKGVGVPFMPQTGSNLFGAQNFSGLDSWFAQVTYIGAFDAGDNWLDGWICFDPQNAQY